MQLCNRDKGTINPKLEHILLITMLTIKILFAINPFAPEPPVRIHVLSTLCDIISFNGQGQLWLLTYAE